MTTATQPLTDTQMLVLAHAKESANLFVLPLPPSVKARGSVKRYLLTALLKLDMIRKAPLTMALLPGGPMRPASTISCT